MHETVFAQQIIETAKKQGKVKKIIVEVGTLAHVPASDMKEVLHRMVPDWEIEVIDVGSKVKCSCGYEGEPNIVEHSHDHVVFFCPKCKEVPKILKGKDITLKSVEVED